LRSVQDDGDVRNLPRDCCASSALTFLIARHLGPGKICNVAPQELPAVLTAAAGTQLLAAQSVGHGGASDEYYTETAGQVRSHADAFDTLLRHLVDSPLPTWWEREVRPQLSDLAEVLSRETARYDDGALIADVARMSNSPVPATVWVYLSFLSRPISYHLSETEFVQNSTDADDGRHILRSVAHETLHGFASAELGKRYESLVTQDEYLQDVLHQNEWSRGIGPEEMFVTAADLYLSVVHGLYTYDDALFILDGFYGSSLPLAVIVFDMLYRQGAVPHDYDAWLLGAFKSGLLTPGSIAEKANAVIPGYVDGLTKSMACHDAYLRGLSERGLIPKTD
jgi:hypothetical protein